jgi:hypothetical protein
MPEQVDVKVAQLRLMILWLIGSSPSFVLLLTRTLGENSLNIQKQWGWLLASLMPTLSLVIGTYAAAAHQNQSDKSADKTFFRVTLGLSVAYLLIVTLALIFCEFDRESPMKTLDNISLVIGPLQGLVSASLGVFFVSQKTKTKLSTNVKSGANRPA